MSDTLQLTAIDWKTVRSGTHCIPLGLIRSSPENARKDFSQRKIDERKESLKNNGQISPGLARPIDDNGDGCLFELVDGELRLRALRQLSGEAFATLRCEVKEVSSLAAAHREMMITHVNREDLNPIESGNMWLREKELSGMSVEDLAEQLGWAGRERTIYNLMSLAKLIPDAQAAVTEGRISQEHGVAIARESDVDQVLALAACFRAEAQNNGADMTEMVQVLVSVKELRTWIQTNLRRKEAPVPELAFEETPAAVEGQLEARADAMLDTAGGDAETQTADGDDGHGSENPSADAPSSPAAEEPSAHDEERLRRRALLVKIAAGHIEVCDDLLRYTIRKLIGMLLPMPAIMEARQALGWKGDEYQSLKGDGLGRALAVILCCDEVNPHMELDCIPRFNIGCVRSGEEFRIGIERSANDAPGEALVGVPTSGTRKKAKCTPAELDVLKALDESAKYIADALEIDDTDVTSMRETGISDESLANLLEAVFDAPRFRHLKNYDLEFDAKGLKFSVDGVEVFKTSGSPYIDEIRKAFKVPQEGKTAKKPKVKTAKKRAGKK